MLVMEGVTVETEDSLYPMEEAVVPGVIRVTGALEALRVLLGQVEGEAALMMLLLMPLMDMAVA